MTSTMTIDGSKSSSSFSSVSTIEDSAAKNKKDEQNSTMLCPAICCAIITLLLLLFLSGFFSQLAKSGQAHEATAANDDNYIKDAKTKKDASATTSMDATTIPTTKIATISSTGAITTKQTSPKTIITSSATTTQLPKTTIITSETKKTTQSSAKPTPTSKTTQSTTITTTTKSTTTPPWHSMEYLCLYTNETEKFFQEAYTNGQLPMAVCNSLIFAKSKHEAPTFEKDVEAILKFSSLKSKQMRFMIAKHVAKDDDLAQMEPLEASLKKYDLFHGAVMYVYNGTQITTSLTDAFLKFAASVKTLGKRAVLLVELYAGWEKSFSDLGKIVAQNLTSIFRSANILDRIKTSNIQCKNMDHDATGPSTIREETTKFIKLFNGQFDKYRRQIGFYAYKEGQNNASLPREAFRQEIFGVGPLYGSCIYLPIYLNDTDCTAIFAFNHLPADESFVTWVGRYIFIMHEESFDNTNTFDCTNQVSIFKNAHPAKNSTQRNNYYDT